MKNITLILALIFISSSAAFAQKRSELKGPAYKNYKPWKHKSTPTVIYTEENKKSDLTGPAYKNYKPWKDTTEASYAVVKFGTEKSKIMGHEFKNYKPWRKNNDNEDTRIAKNDS